MNIQTASLLILLIVSYISPFTAVLTDILFLPSLILAVTAFILGFFLAKKTKSLQKLLKVTYLLSFFTVFFQLFFVLPSSSVGIITAVLILFIVSIPMLLGAALAKIKSFRLYAKKILTILLLGVTLVGILYFEWSKTDILVFGDEYDKQIHNCIIKNQDIIERHACIMSIARTIYKFDNARAIDICVNKTPVGIISSPSSFPGVVEAVCQGELRSSSAHDAETNITSTEDTNSMTDWLTYRNNTYGFSFMHPENIAAYDAIDHTGGQIPDVAGFGYTQPGEFEPGQLVPADKQGSARIIVWQNRNENLESFARADAQQGATFSQKIINGTPAIISFATDETYEERQAKTTKNYYIKKGNTIYQVMAFTVNNEYTYDWIVLFDDIMQTFTLE